MKRGRHTNQLQQTREGSVRGCTQLKRLAVVCPENSQENFAKYLKKTSLLVAFSGVGKQNLDFTASNKTVRAERYIDFVKDPGKNNNYGAFPFTTMHGHTQRFTRWSFSIDEKSKSHLKVRTVLT